MAYVDPIWLEGRRRYWQRHDAHRFRRPDGSEYKSHATRLIEQRQAEEEEARIAAEQEAMRETLLWLRRELAEVKFALAMRRIAHKYDPNQPRTPKGNPDGGQWTQDGGGDAGKDGDDSLMTEDAALRRGHHYVARQTYRRRNLSLETKKVFEEATTGKLQDRTTNVFDKAHRNYNKAVDELFDRFLAKNGISEEQMSPDHARQLLKEVVTSSDPRIRNFNLRVWMREIVRLPRFRGND
jgi:hypothetical protein